MPTVANKRLQHNISKIFREGALLEDFAGNPTRSCDKVPRRISQDRDRRTFYRIIQRSSKILVRQEPERASQMIHTSTSSTTFKIFMQGRLRGLHYDLSRTTSKGALKCNDLREHFAWQMLQSPHHRNNSDPARTK
jgi:hypothetical protein